MTGWFDPITRPLSLWSSVMYVLTFCCAALAIWGSRKSVRSLGLDRIAVTSSDSLPEGLSGDCDLRFDREPPSISGKPSNSGKVAVVLSMLLMSIGLWFLGLTLLKFNYQEPILTLLDILFGFILMVFGLGIFPRDLHGGNDFSRHPITAVVAAPPDPNFPGFNKVRFEIVTAPYDSHVVYVVVPGSAGEGDEIKLDLIVSTRENSTYTVVFPGDPWPKN